MKKLTIFCLLSSTLAFGQVKIMTNEEAAQNGIDIKKLDSTYNIPFKGVRMVPETSLKSQQQFLMRVNGLARKLRSKGDNAGIMAQFYINPKGKCDYVFYTVEGKLNPLTEQRLRDSLQVYLDKYVFSNPTATPQILYQMMTVGLLRQTPKGDSTINTIEQALATTRPDTVKVLALNQLELKAVPYELIYKFANMKELNLAANELTRVQLDFTRLPKLRQLWLNNNLLTEDSLQLSPNKTLKILNIQGNRFVDVPATVRQCKRLTSLWLGYNKLTQLQNGSFRRLRRLQDINLYSCELQSLPKGIAKLKRLEVLDVYYNSLTTLPKSLGRMKRLQQLALSHNSFEVLPTQIGRLKRIQTLYIHHNKLEQLPRSIGRLRNLKILDIGHNRFSTLPPQIGQLTQVEDLDASYNNLSEVPAQVLQMPNLKKLHLRENPFTDDATLLSRSKTVLNALSDQKIDVYY
ncbi:MAG: leucine-rich repeat domain-containing protein [Spirosomaceae bacterium]|nr:leucine-rich repeat domain-containing protein [Spirosomataceae bacterium]